MLYVKKDLNVRMSALAESVTLPFSASNSPFEVYTKFFVAFITSWKHTEREGNLFRLQERGHNSLQKEPFSLSFSYHKL